MSVSYSQRGSASNENHVSVQEGLYGSGNSPGITLCGRKVLSHTVALVILVLLTLFAFLVALFTGIAPVMGLDFSPGNIFSAILGWVYQFIWSTSFLPQLFVIRQPDLSVPRLLSLSLNIIGYLFYLPYTLGFCFNKEARKIYEQKYDGIGSNVALNDVLFAACALVFCLMDGVQIIRLDCKRKMPGIILGLLFVITSFSFLLCFCLFALDFLRSSSFTCFEFLFAMNLGKLVASCVKYLLQIFVNCKRAKLMGRNNWSSILDFVGGLLSTTQELFEGYATGNWRGIIDYPVKSVLGSATMVFNILFLLLKFVHKSQEEHFVTAGSDNNLE